MKLKWNMNVTFIQSPNLAKWDAVVHEAMNLFWNNKGGDGDGNSVIEKTKHKIGITMVSLFGR